MSGLKQYAILILRSRPQVGVSKDEASWFETRRHSASKTRVNALTAVLFTMRQTLMWI